MKARVKINFPPEPEKQGPHLLALTQDVLSVINGGLSFADGNLPLSLYRKRVSSGVPFEVTGFGAAVMFSSANLLKYKTKLLKNNLLRVTMEFDEAQSDVVLLITKETI